MGVGCLTVLLAVLYLFVSAGPDKKLGRTSEVKADVNLLTGSDARTLGLEALGAELRSSQRAQRALEEQLEKLKKEGSAKKDVEQLGNEIAVLKQTITSLQQDSGRKSENAAFPMGNMPAHGQSGETLRQEPSVPISAIDGKRNGIDGGARPTGSAKDAPGDGETQSDGGFVNVRVYGEQEQKPVEPVGQKAGEIYIPAGSLLSGVLLTGVDAPTGMQSKRDPIPALMRVKHEAILPNRFRSDVKECFVIFGATGDLSTERALLRAETLSCIRQDGGVIEVAIDAYAMGDDGKAGIRGRLVSRNGSLVAKAAFASFAEALSQVFRPVAIQGFNTAPGQRTQFQAPDASEALEAAGYAGFGGAMRRLSEYFVDLADEIVPFVEVDAARQIEAVLLKGVTLAVRSNAK